jgi:hypothetical protein
MREEIRPAILGARQYTTDEGPTGPDISQQIEEEERSYISNPTVLPTAQVSGTNEKPRAMFVSSVSSAIILFMTPIFPFSIPFKQRLGKRI